MKADAIGICSSDGKHVDLDFARHCHRYSLCAYDLRGFAPTTCVVDLACAVALPDAGKSARRFKTAVASTIWGFMLLFLTFSS